MTKFNTFFFHKKTFSKVGIDEISSICSIYEKPTANIIFNGERHKAFTVKSGTRKRCPLLPLLFNIILDMLARALKQKNQIKRIQIGKEIKVFIFADSQSCIQIMIIK